METENRVASHEDHDPHTKQQQQQQEKKLTVIHQPPCSPILSVLAVWLWLSGLYVNGLVLPVSLFLLPVRYSLIFVGFLLILMAIPLYENTKIASGVSKFICKYGPNHFPITMVVEDIDAFDLHRAYIFAGEPHSVFPLGLVALFGDAGYLPLTKVKGLATSMGFIAPITRHVWTWLGIAPATMKNFLKYLRAGNSCIIIPGGAKEVFYMKHGCEVVFLKKRLGFVRAAILTGCPLVPVFVFGQTQIFSWYKPKGRWYECLCRIVKFTPVLFWGVFGTPIPYSKPMYLVVGKPIPVQMNADPSADEIEEVKTQFISTLQGLYERHKVAAGYKHIPLFVY